MYHFIKDTDVIFHRTRIINQMIRLAQTEMVAVWDADVIVPFDQLISAINIVKENHSDFVYPIDGRFLDTGESGFDKKIAKQICSAL